MSSWTPSGGRTAWPTGFSGEIRILGLAGNSKMPVSGCSEAGAGRAERLALQGFAYGAGKGTRTPDPLLGKQMLYQLSYSRSPQPTVKYYYTEHYSSWGGGAQGHRGTEPADLGCGRAGGERC